MNTRPADRNDEVCYIPPAPEDAQAAEVEIYGLPFPLIRRKGWVRVCGVWMKKDADVQRFKY